MTNILLIKVESSQKQSAISGQTIEHGLDGCNESSRMIPTG
jgi:hypothetical protein